MESEGILPTQEIKGDRIHSTESSAPCRHSHCHATVSWLLQNPALALAPLTWDVLSLWDENGVQPCAFGTQPLPCCWGLCTQHGRGTCAWLRNMAGRGCSGVLLPKLDKALQGRSSAPDVSYPEHSDVAPLSGDVLIFLWQISSYWYPAKPKLMTPNTGNTQMVFAADHILPSLSSSWPTQFMSLQRTLHPLPSGVWIQPEFASTPIKFGHDLWKPSTILKTKDVLMMPDWWMHRGQRQLMRQDHVSPTEILAINHTVKGAKMMTEANDIFTWDLNVFLTDNSFRTQDYWASCSELHEGLWSVPHGVRLEKAWNVYRLFKLQENFSLITKEDTNQGEFLKENLKVEVFSSGPKCN